MRKLPLLGALLLTCTTVLCQILSDNYREPSLTVGQEVTTDATYYAKKFNGRPTSSGELIDPKLMTAAMHAFPFDGPKTDFKYFRVTRLENGVKTDRSVIVKVNDYMPDRHAGIDLSRGAARALDMMDAGRIAVVIERVSGPGAPTKRKPAPGPVVSRPTTGPVVTDPTPPLPRLEQRTGLALPYADPFIGMKTKSGEIYRAEGMTAGHRSLPMGTVVRVTRPDNQRSVVVRINDRGARGKDRIVDLSHAAARALDMDGAGLVQVSLDVLPPDTPLSVAADTEVATTTPPTTNRPVPYEKEAAKPRPKKGYGVQVAFSTTYEGAQQLTKDLRTRLGEPVMLSEKTNATTGRKEYRVVVGAVDTYQQAAALRDRLALSPDAFVVALQNL